MQNRESVALINATQHAIDATTAEHRFTSEDIRRLHGNWLGKIYPWAGSYRSVNMSKDGFPFAAAGQIERLMGELERGPLQDFTPCRFTEHGAQAKALAVVHAELTLIHPFRDGNGRCARMLATLAAIHQGMERDYGPMTEVFGRVIARTMRAHSA